MRLDITDVIYDLGIEKLGCVIGRFFLTIEMPREIIFLLKKRLSDQ